MLFRARQRLAPLVGGAGCAIAGFAWSAMPALHVNTLTAVALGAAALLVASPLLLVFTFSRDKT